MKAKQLRALALLGMTAGILGMDVGLEAYQDEHRIDLNYVLAKPKCKAQGGCGGLIAERDSNRSLRDEMDDDEEENGDDDRDFDEDDDDDDDKSNY